MKVDRREDESMHRLEEEKRKTQRRPEILERLMGFRHGKVTSYNSKPTLFFNKF